MSDQTLLWVGFNVFVLAMLALDLGVFHRKDHTIQMKEALAWSAVWVSLALLFNLGLYLWRGPEAGLEFLTGYLLEKALSIDNIFVFLLIFALFGVPARYQHKILVWGILGALVMRAAFIFAGVTLIERFHWTIYVFGAFLIFTGIRMALHKDEQIKPEKSLSLRILRRFIPIVDHYGEGKFFVREQGRRVATLMFLVLVFVDITDLMFAVDSIPAILAVTSDPFIVYTSNVFAILGLRALYFAVAGLMQLFHYLHHGLSAVLIFVGVKMVLADVYKIPVGVALGVVAAILVAAVIASLVWPRRGGSEPPPQDQGGEEAAHSVEPREASQSAPSNRL